MSNITRVFFIIKSFSLGGGAEALLTTIMNALDDTGRYQIGMMELIHCDVKQEPIHDSIRVYPYFTEADSPDRQQRMYYVFHEWDRVIEEYVPDDYDVYISFNYLRPSFLLPKDKKSISWIHGDVYDLINKYPNQTKDMSEERELQREAFRSVNKILAISDITKESLVEIYPEYANKILLFPNGLDVKTIRKMSKKQTEIVLNNNSVVFIGRLDTNKNPIRALNIIKKVLDVRDDTHLYYLGYGALEGDLIAAIDKEGLSDHVHLLGYHDNPFPIIRQAKVTIMTSYSEGFPMALLESVALGVPFVSTVVGGSRMLCKDKRVGAVFGDDNDAASEILRFLEMDINVVNRACDKVIGEYDLPGYVERIENIIREVLES